VRRLAIVLAAAAAAACNDTSTAASPAPGDQFYQPTGIGVHAGKLLVASSNSDLRFDAETGGSVIAVDPATSPPALVGTVNVRSFAGMMAIADPLAGCPIANPEQGALALVPVRGEDQLYRVRVGAGGALACDGCALPVGGAEFVDPFAVGVACGDGRARAFVGYLRTTNGASYLTQVDLAKAPGEEGAVQTRNLQRIGQVRAFAHDPELRRLYFTRTVNASAATLLWLDLGGGCELVPPTPPEGQAAAPACRMGETGLDVIPRGLELRGIALSSSSVPHRRAYLTARIYDADAAALSGVRVGDYDGLLLVADLVESLAGDLQLRFVRQIPIGYGAGEVVRLPARAGGRRDVVAALATDSGVLWLYDDDTGELVALGRDELTGHPLVGRVPFGLAADPVAVAGVARLYVGSFQESFVTRIDVPLDDPGAAAILPDRLTGGVTP
jgi:hypothetical protein